MPNPTHTTAPVTAVTSVNSQSGNPVRPRCRLALQEPSQVRSAVRPEMEREGKDPVAPFDDARIGLWARHHLRAGFPYVQTTAAGTDSAWARPRAATPRDRATGRRRREVSATGPVAAAGTEADLP